VFLVGCGGGAGAVDSGGVGLDVPCDHHLHTHSFTSDVSASGYDVYAQILQARVYLHEDLLAAADLDSLLCDGGEGQETWLGDCVRGANDPVMYGGTAIEPVSDDAGAAHPDYLLWTFGDGDGVLVPTPISDDDEEGFFFRIAWAPLQGVEAVGTTSADVELLYGGFDQACDPDTQWADQSCWIVVEDPAAPGSAAAHWGPESAPVTTTSAVNLGDCE